MNKVFLIGRLTRDPELRYTGSNIAVANFSLAVNRPFSNAAGEREADFINIIVWRKQAENVKNYLSQGSQVAVDGRIQTRSYDAQDGQKRYVTEVVADNVEFLGSKSGNNNTTQSNEQGAENVIPVAEPTPYDFANNSQPENKTRETQNNTTSETASNPFADFGASIEIDDNELPF